MKNTSELLYNAFGNLLTSEQTVIEDLMATTEGLKRPNVRDSERVGEIATRIFSHLEEGSR